MKRLFISFVCVEDDITRYGNMVIAGDTKLSDAEDILSLQEYIEMTRGIYNVTIINYRRME